MSNVPERPTARLACHSTWPAWPSPDYAKLRAAVSAGPVPMPSRLFISDEQATTAATTARASTLWLSMATTRAACTMRASAVQWSSTTPQRR